VRFELVQGGLDAWASAQLKQGAVIPMYYLGYTDSLLTVT